MFLKKYLTSVALSCVLLVGCSQSTADPSQNTNLADNPQIQTQDTQSSLVNLDGKSFTLESYNGQMVTIPATLSFEKGNLHAKICNTINGAYTIEGGLLKSENAISTKMACIDEKVSTVENEFLKLLSVGATVMISDTSLTLSSEGHSFIFDVAAPEDAANMVTGVYTLLSFNDKNFSNDAYTLTLTRTELSAKFCNQLGGSYALISEGSDVKISGTLRSTLMFCADTNLMEAENAFNKFLSDGVKFSEKDGILTFSSDTGNLVYKKN